MYISKIIVNTKLHLQINCYPFDVNLFRQISSIIASDESLIFEVLNKGGLIPLFSDISDTKYRAENFTDTDSDTDTNAYRHMVAIISHLLLYKYIDKAFK